MQNTTPQSITLTNRTLIKYTLISFVFAVITLLTVILPAEYNIDPTGIGHKLGLTIFHHAKAETSAKPSTQATSEKGATATIEIIVPADSGVEYKFVMQQYQKIEYEWLTSGAVLYFDLHGEPEGDTTGYFESYAIATLDEMKGSFTTPFAGSHGWYWKNTSDVAVTVLLTVKGKYEQHGLK
ncbi:MAG: hypothetical protein JKY81_12750 [Colwellia sp.]|nr:hypothetical protein [Colwellia sp.]